jgi:hypothetical protein
MPLPSSRTAPSRRHRGAPGLQTDCFGCAESIADRRWACSTRSRRAGAMCHAMDFAGPGGPGDRRPGDRPGSGQAALCAGCIAAHASPAGPAGHAGRPGVGRPAAAGRQRRGAVRRASTPADRRRGRDPVHRRWILHRLRTGNGRPPPESEPFPQGRSGPGRGRRRGRGRTARGGAGALAAGDAGRSARNVGRAHPGSARPRAPRLARRPGPRGCAPAAATW